MKCALNRSPKLSSLLLTIVALPIFLSARAQAQPSTNQPFNIPFQCIEKTIEKGVAHFSLKNSEKMHTNKNFPKVVFIKNSCLPYLEAQVKKTNRNYFLHSSDKPMFPYVPSSNRPYCGTQPTQNYCTNSVYYDASVVVPTDAQVVPYGVFSPLKSLQNLKPESIDFEYNSSVELIATKKPSTHNSVRVYSLNAENTKILNQGYVSYIHLLGSRYESETWKSIEKRSFNRRVMNILATRADQWRRTHSSGWLSTNSDATNFTRYLQERAAVLQRQWKKSRTFLNIENSSNEILKNFEDIETHFIKPFNLSLPEIDKRSLLVLVEEFTQFIIQEASEVLSYSQNQREILQAASFWWAARGAQIDMGCNIDSDKPYPVNQAKQFVLNQYSYQTCRRFYTNNAYIQLNQMLDAKEKLDLNTVPWSVAIALGSRRERLVLFTKAFNVLELQIKKNQMPKYSEISMITYEILKTIEEKKSGRVLTWNGFKPASTLDIEKMNEFLSAAKTFFINTAPSIFANRWKKPKTFLNYQIAWNQVKEPLKLEDMSTALVLYNNNSTILNALSNQTSLEGLLAKNKLNSKNKIKYYIHLYEASKNTTLLQPESDPELCSIWLNHLHTQSKKEKMKTFKIFHSYLRNNHKYKGCIALIPLWATSHQNQYYSNPEQLTAQCNQGHALSCITRYRLHSEKFASDPKNWLNILAGQPLQFSLFKTLVDEYKFNMKNTRKWRKITKKIHFKQRDFFNQHIKALPNIETFNQCIDKKSWFDLLQSDVNMDNADIKRQFVLKDTCEKTQVDEVLNWAPELLMLRRISIKNQSTSVWSENVFSAIYRYLYWNVEMKPASNAYLRPSKLPKLKALKQYNSEIKAYLERPALLKPNDPKQYFWFSTGDFLIASKMKFGIDWLIRSIRYCENNNKMFCDKERLAPFKERQDIPNL